MSAGPLTAGRKWQHTVTSRWRPGECGHLPTDAGKDAGRFSEAEPANLTSWETGQCVKRRVGFCGGFPAKCMYERMPARLEDC